MSCCEIEARLDFYRFFPPQIKRELDGILLNHASLPSEIHLKIGKASSFIIDGERKNLSARLEMRDIERLFELITENSLYAYRDTVLSGYITLRGGVRVGVVGEARYNDGKIVGISHISSLCFRIPSGESSFGDELLCAFQAARSGLLIYSSPGAGKTSALRTLSKIIGSGSAGKKLALLDERLEFSPEDYFDKRVDLLRGYKKKDGLEIALRSLSPDVIMVDEIGSDKEAEAMLPYLNSGVKIVATAHAKSYTELYKKKNLSAFFEHGVFDSFVGLWREGKEFFCEVRVPDN